MTLLLNQVVEELGFTHFPMVPCSRLATIFDHEQSPNVLLATREEEALALGCGILLAGHNPLPMMQSSGLANALNTLGGLAVAYGLPLVVLVAMRGHAQDHNATQRPVYQALREAVSALGCVTIDCTDTAQLEGALSAAKASARDHCRPCIVTIV